MSDDTKQTLTFKTTDVVKSLETELQTRADKRAAAKEKQDAENKKKFDQLVGLMGDVPEFLVWIVKEVNTCWGHGNVGSEQFDEHIRNTYKAQTDGSTSGPDTDLKRLIRVYQLTTDETVVLAPQDEPYYYL